MIQWLWRRVAGISVRLLVLNLLMVAMPALFLLALPTFERALLRNAQDGLGGQAALFAAALSAKTGLRSADLERSVRDARARSDVRVRIIDAEGYLVADSQRLDPARPPLEVDPPERARIDHRMALGIVRWLERERRRFVSAAPVDANPYLDATPFLTPEVLAALAGRLGEVARTHVLGGAPTLYSARPIYGGEEVIGAVLLSQSGEKIHEQRRDLEALLVKVLAGALGLALVVTAVGSRSIVAPLRRLRREADSLLDRRGRVRGSLGGAGRNDEIGDIARTFQALSERLEERVGFIEGFAADVSHEFKNPLASIRVATEIITDMDEPKERKRFLSFVERDVARIEHLLDALREVTQIDAQRDPGDEGAVDLKEMLSQIAEAFRMRFGDRVKIEVVAPEGPIQVYGGQGRLVQVFENLLDNAVSFSPEGGRVFVEVKGGEREASVSVRDQGPGIPEHHRERVFRRFFSYRPGDEDGDRPHTGLGLAIVKAIVEGYGGTVVANSAEDTGGAEFVVRLPALGH